MKRNLVLLSLALTAFTATFAATRLWNGKTSLQSPPGMVWIRGGEFTMGTDSERPGPRKSRRTGCGWTGSGWIGPR